LNNFKNYSTNTSEISKSDLGNLSIMREITCEEKDDFYLVMLKT